MSQLLTLKNHVVNQLILHVGLRLINMPITKTKERLVRVLTLQASQRQILVEQN